MHGDAVVRSRGRSGVVTVPSIEALHERSHPPGLNVEHRSLSQPVRPTTSPSGCPVNRYLRLPAWLMAVVFGPLNSRSFCYAT